MNSFRGATLLLLPMLAIACANRLACGQDANRQPTQQIKDGPCVMTVDIQPASTRVADPVTIRLRVDAPEGSSMTFPSFEGTLGTWLIVDADLIAALPVEGQNKTRRWLATVQLESLETGEIQIPSLEVTYQLPGTRSTSEQQPEGVLRSKPMKVAVASVLDAKEDPVNFRDIKGPTEIQPNVTRATRLPWVMAVLGALLGVAGVAYYRRRSAPDAGTWARQQIERVESEFKNGAIDDQTLYSRLSTLLREFLQAELKIPATAESPEEIRHELSRLEGFDSVVGQVTQYFQTADEQRFSGQHPSASGPVEPPFEALRSIIHDVTRARHFHEKQEAA